LQQRAASGEARAQGELGGLMLVGRDAPYAPAEAMLLLNAAALQGDADALLLLSVLAALGEGRPQNWTDAMALVARAAQNGSARAQGQLAVLGDPAQFDVASWFKPLPVTKHFDAPRIFTVENFLPAAACEWLIAQASSRLAVARVKNPEQGGAVTNDYRTNSGMGFSVLDSDVVLQLTHARIAAAIGLPVMQQEPTNVLHYAVGQEYKPHFDFIDPGEAHFAGELQRLGQRLVTFLIYLNDDYEGGETAFSRLNWAFKGKAGDALIFWNVSAQGDPERNSLHAGLPPTRGEKWLFSKWVRDRALPLI
jgi:predicted 2-oxoglutarate/Fe(II)-dependent dioxygenase YbiX